MRSMRQRAEILGGNLRIDSGPGAGTRVKLRVPRRTAILAPPNDEEGASTDVYSSGLGGGVGSGCTAFAYGSELEGVRQKAVKEVHWTCERPGRQPCLTLI
jgi:hypothetical protein